MTEAGHAPLDTAAMTPLETGRDAFAVPGDVAYLNCGYFAPPLRAVAAAGQAALRTAATPWARVPADFFDGPERLRAGFAALTGARAADIALIPAVSYGVATAAKNLPLSRGEVILGCARQFPSNVYGWKDWAAAPGATVRLVERMPDRSWTETLLDAIGPETALVAVPHVHWADGQILDLERIARKARTAGRKGQGAAVFLDLTQSAGAYPIDLTALAPDFAACSGYKWLLGPYGLSYLYVHPRWQDGTPLEQNWMGRTGADDFNRLTDYRDSYGPGAVRFDMGEKSNFVAVAMAEAGLKALSGWTVPAIVSALSSLAETLTACVAAHGFRPAADGQAPHYLMYAREMGIPGDIVARLAARNVFVSLRDGSLRLTPHLHVTERDVSTLDAALTEIL